MFELGDKVIWSRVNYDKSETQSCREKKKVLVTESFPALIVEVKPKQYLLEFEKNKVRKWILKSNARLEKITE